MPSHTDYWQKDASPETAKNELSWNFPEQRQKTLAILGGNSQAFSTEIKLAELLLKSFPFLKSVQNFFPDSLKSKLPPLPNLAFFESTDSGSFKKSSELSSALIKTDFSLFSGDFSKNSETAIAVSDLLKSAAEIPAVLARDSLDLVATEAASFMTRDNLTLVASLAQLQKLFRALYYPKMLFLSSPLFPVVETLHKFTLSYPVAILTFHEGQILLAENGRVLSVPLEKTYYTPLTLWSGEVAARFAVYHLFNPNSRLDSLLAAISKA